VSFSTDKSAWAPEVDPNADIKDTIIEYINDQKIAIVEEVNEVCNRIMAQVNDLKNKVVEGSVMEDLGLVVEYDAT
jgi:hypothetical protein